jgi:hypothetical protein
MALIPKNWWSTERGGVEGHDNIAEPEKKKLQGVGGRGEDISLYPSPSSWIALDLIFLHEISWLKSNHFISSDGCKKLLFLILSCSVVI